LENVDSFVNMGGLIAPGTDAGAWAVPQGCLTEYELLKNVPEEELIEAIHTVYEGSDYISKEMVPHLVDGFVNRHEEGKGGYLSLRERELEVLSLIARGYGNKEIGEKLFISVKTVESYRAKIMNKLGLRTRAELVEYALRKKLLQ